MFRRGAINDPELTMIFNTGVQWEADQAKSLLEQAGIPVLMMDHEDSGDYLRILGYGSPFGFDLYVSRANADRARALIEEVFSEDNSVSEEELERIALEAHSDEV